MEREIGYRGSKLIIFYFIIKEQRVDDSCHIRFMWFRRTLMSFEKNCQFKRVCIRPGLEQQVAYAARNLSKQIRRLYTSTAVQSEKHNVNFERKVIKNLDPYFITGFVDGEGCFFITIVKDSKHKNGWMVQVSFQITVNKKDLNLLEQIEKYFGVGNITKQKSESINYRIQSVRDLRVIIQHFDNFSLLTHKYSDYLLFKQVVELMQSKKHLTEEGLYKIVDFKASLNRGLSEELQIAFPDVTPIARSSLSDDQKILTLSWLSGFASAEGCFFIHISKSKTSKLGEAVQLRFILVQHIREEFLMRNINQYLKCGNLIKKERAVYFTVSKFSDLTEIIIPFFKQNPIHGIKSKDFADFCEVAELIKNKSHLTLKGFNKIRNIKSGMNTGRE